MPEHLILLPTPPSKLEFSAFKAAYIPGLTKAITTILEQAEGPQKQILDVAVECINQSDRLPGRARNNLYSYAQHVTALLYRLTCQICAEKGISTQGPGSIDVRIVLLETIPDPSYGLLGSVRGPIFPLAELATSSKLWRTIFHLATHFGYDLFLRFSRIREVWNFPLPQLCSICEVPGGASAQHSDHGTVYRTFDDKPHDQSNYSHTVVAVGGTWDHLHEGHKLLLSATALVLNIQLRIDRDRPVRLIVGITGDELLVNKKYAEVMESWEDRQGAVVTFLSSIMSLSDDRKAIKNVVRFNEPGPNGTAIHYTFSNGVIVECVKISDPFGPTITDESVTALAISAETRAGGKAVNDKRGEKGWAPLEVFEVDVLDANAEKESGDERSGNFQSKISSTEIRRRLQEKQKL